MVVIDQGFSFVIFALSMSVQIATVFSASSSTTTTTSTSNFMPEISATSTINPTSVSLFTTPLGDKVTSPVALSSVYIPSTTVVYTSNVTVAFSLEPSPSTSLPVVVSNSSNISQTLYSSSISQTQSITSAPINSTSQTFSSTLASFAITSLTTESSISSIGSSMSVPDSSNVATSSISISPTSTIPTISTKVTTKSSTITVTSSIQPTSSSTVSPAPSSAVTTPTATPEHHSESKKAGLSNGGKAAIGIFVTILIIAIIAGLLWMRKRKWFRDGTSITSSIQYKPWKYTDEASVNFNR